MEPLFDSQTQSSDSASVKRSERDLVGSQSSFTTEFVLQEPDPDVHHGKDRLGIHQGTSAATSNEVVQSSVDPDVIPLRYTVVSCIRLQSRQPNVTADQVQAAVEKSWQVLSASDKQVCGILFFACDLLCI